MKNIKDFKYAGIMLLLFLAVFIYFTRSLAEALGLWWAFLILIYIPGYFIAEYAFDTWDELEKSIISPFAGIGLTPLFLYYLSIFGINSVQSVFCIIFAVIFLILTLFKDKILKNNRKCILCKENIDGLKQREI